jgi:hypothetical protein
VDAFIGGAARGSVPFTVYADPSKARIAHTLSFKSAAEQEEPTEFVDVVTKGLRELHACFVADNVLRCAPNTHTHTHIYIYIYTCIYIYIYMCV